MLGMLAGTLVTSAFHELLNAALSHIVFGALPGTICDEPFHALFDTAFGFALGTSLSKFPDSVFDELGTGTRGDRRPRSSSSHPARALDC